MMIGCIMFLQYLGEGVSIVESLYCEVNFGERNTFLL